VKFVKGRSLPKRTKRCTSHPTSMKNITSVQNVESDFGNGRIFAITWKLMMVFGTLNAPIVTRALLTQVNSNCTTWESTLSKTSDVLSAFFAQRRLQPELRLKNIWEVMLEKSQSFVTCVTTRMQTSLAWKNTLGVFTIVECWHGTLTYHDILVSICFFNDGSWIIWFVNFVILKYLAVLFYWLYFENICIRFHSYICKILNW